MELFLDVLGESLVDTAKMLPFLFLAYLFIEYVEHRHGEKIEAVLERSGRWGAIPASLRRRRGSRGWLVAGHGAAVRLFGHCIELLCLPRHLAGHPHRGVHRHQRRGGAAADLDAGVLG